MIGSDPKVSIVIPAYNADEKLLKSCLKSVLSQTYRNIEIVLVNDGSTDNTGKVLDELSRGDKRIRVIHKPNGGVSDARNRGKTEASGDYVMFVDADDLLLPHAVSEGVETALRYNADMVIGAQKVIYSHEDKIEKRQESSIMELKGNDDFDLLRQSYFNCPSQRIVQFVSDGYIGRGPYCKLITKSVANQCDFPKGLALGEDAIWSLRILNKCQKVCVLNDIWYGYLRQETSAIHKYYGNRNEIASRYLQLLKQENEEFCNEYPFAPYRNTAIEFYCVLNYELLSGKCHLSTKEKKRYVVDMLSEEPWKILKDRELRKKLPFAYRLLVDCSENGMWVTYLKAKNMVKRKNG